MAGRQSVRTDHNGKRIEGEMSVANGQIEVAYVDSGGTTRTATENMPGASNAEMEAKAKELLKQMADEYPRK